MGVIAGVTKTIARHAPLILTISGSVGVIGTGLLAADGTMRAMSKLDSVCDEIAYDGVIADLVEKDGVYDVDEAMPNYYISGVKETARAIVKSEHLSKADKFRIVAPCYIPATIAAIGSILSIIFAHRLDAGRYAGLLTAYAGLEEMYYRYYQRSQDYLTEPKQQAIRADIAQQIVNASADVIDEDLAVYDGRGTHRYFDAFTRTLFLSSQDRVAHVEAELNRKKARGEYVTVGDMLMEFGYKDPPYYAWDLYWDPCDTNPIVITTEVAEDQNGEALTVIMYNLPVQQLHVRTHLDIRGGRISTN